MKNNMKATEYYKSGQHSENVRRARIRGSKISQENARIRREEKIREYDINPKKCNQCENKIEYKNRKNNFCSSSCSASYNNQKRKDRGWKLSIESKNKISNANKNKPKVRSKNSIGRNYTKIFLIQCIGCGQQKLVNYKKKHHKTCGKIECKIHASVGVRPYINGRRKLFWYYNKNEKKKVLLESSWELNLAIWFDELDINWIRPGFLKWFDKETNKERLYYPDFYLSDFDLYVDPKNSYGMADQASKIKMNAVKDKVKIIYGDINLVKKEILENIEIFYYTF